MSGGEVFVFDQQRVRFQDVDHAGIVFFACIYVYCHVVFEEFVEQVMGLPPREFFDARGLGAPLVATRSEHLHPLRHGDRLVIALRVASLGRSSMTIRYEIRNQDAVLCAVVHTTQAFVELAAMKSRPIPEDIRGHLERHLVVEVATDVEGTADAP